ncbi:MAG TPA: hypothetical protein VGK19_24260 [Capsulimonadaceae bacterium]|jgi:hypothetical protein
MHTRFAVALTLYVLVLLVVMTGTQRLLAVDLLNLAGREYVSTAVTYRSPNPNDFEENLAGIVYSPDVVNVDSNTPRATAVGAVQAIHQLAMRFPGETAAIAEACRVEVAGLGRLNRQVECHLSTMPPCDVRTAPFDPALLRNLLADSGAACRIEPNNGYFALVRSYALFAAKRDREAMSELGRASRCTDWNEHAADARRGQARLLDSLDGGNPYVLDQVLSGSYDVARTIREPARVVIANAIQLERHGDFDDGMRIRRMICRIGALEGARCLTDVGYNDANSLISLAARYPNGDKTKRPSGPRAPQYQEFYKGIFAKYCRKHRYDSDLRDYDIQFGLYQARTSIRNAAAENQGNVLLERGNFDLGRHVCLLLLLGVALWTVAARRLTLQRFARTPSPLPLATACGIGASTAFVAAIGLWFSFGFDGGDQTRMIYGFVPPELYALAFGILAAVFSAVASRVGEARFRASLVGRRVAWVLLAAAASGAIAATAAAPVPVAIGVILLLGAGIVRGDLIDFARFGKAFFAIGAATYAINGLMNVFGSGRLFGDPDSAYSYESTGDMILVALIPALIALVAAIVALVKRQPAASVIVHAWRTTLPWVVCALTLTYACVAVPTVRLNDKLCAQTMQRIDDEPGAMAREVGRTWPGR